MTYDNQCSVSESISKNVHIGGAMTLACNGNRVSKKSTKWKIENLMQVLRACVLNSFWFNLLQFDFEVENVTQALRASDIKPGLKLGPVIKYTFIHNFQHRHFGLAFLNLLISSHIILLYTFIKNFPHRRFGLVFLNHLLPRNRQGSLLPLSLKVEE